ncbi:MAG: cell division protein FtsA [Patescibacteria group bacterium]|nr:cell division protein FtsA [Patescibacteria group bacterium]
MPRERIVTGIDIGSSKVCTIIASVSSDSSIERSPKVSIIGVSTVPSNGIRKGVVVDIDEAVESIAQSLEGAERMAGYAVSSAYISVDGKHISSLNSHGVVAVANQEGEITEGDVARVTEAAQAISIPSSREIIHVIPCDFIVDNQGEIRDPVGMSGVRLEVETNIISGATTVMRNLVKCVQQVGVGVSDLVFEGVASAESVLTDTEKELGTILIDVGGGTTSVIVFSGGSPVFAKVLPIGGRNITNDLAVGLRVGLEDAEEIKRRLSVEDLFAADSSEKDAEEDDELDISDLGLEQKTISKKMARNIIEARLQEIFKMVGKEIKSSELEDKLPAGLVVTGGAAQTSGALKAAKRVLGYPVRLGEPRGVSGLIDEIGSPEYASAVGLVLYGAYFAQSGGFMAGFAPGESIGGIIQRVISWIKGFLP